MKAFYAVAIAVMLSGCGTLFPKRVEFGQDKVKAVPEAKASEKETQRQAARMAAEKAEQTLQNAILVDAPPNVVLPAKDTAVLTDAVAESVGAPLKPAPVDLGAREMASSLRTSVAKLGQRMDEFKASNNENAGKKIEGTGFLQIPYFVYILIVGALAFVGVLIGGVLWTILKMYGMSNPPVQLGVSAVQMGAGFLKRALSETVAGGERFKSEILQHVSDPALQEKIKNVFRVEQERAQSKDTQAVVKAMTAKETQL